jgi:hypothetical protein
VWHSPEQTDLHFRVKDFQVVTRKMSYFAAKKWTFCRVTTFAAVTEKRHIFAAKYDIWPFCSTTYFEAKMPKMPTMLKWIAHEK